MKLKTQSSNKAFEGSHTGDGVGGSYCEPRESFRRFLLSLTYESKIKTKAKGIGGPCLGTMKVYTTQTLRREAVGSYTDDEKGGSMSDNVKVFYPNRRMREMAKKQGIEEMTPEELIQDLRKNLESIPKDSDQHKKLLECVNAILKGDMRAFMGLWQDIISKLDRLGETEVGAQSRDGVFVCLSCIGKIDWAHLLTDDDFITIKDLYELKASSFYQCCECGERIEGMG